MLTEDPKPPEFPPVEVLPAQKAPRGSEDSPWEHPADGGAPIGGGDFSLHDDAFGSFQSSEEFPDDIAQALRKVYERMYRAGFRDWEAEWDYVEASYWFIRRHLELNAREVFRLWYGEGKWEEPFRLASHLQETGEVEYRIDHLLTTDLGVEIRKQPTETVPAPPTPSAAAPKGAKKQAVLDHFAEALRDGPLTARQIAERINATHGTHVTYMDVHYHLRNSAPVHTAERAGRNGKKSVLYSLPET
jgi:hypothetical protein